MNNKKSITLSLLMSAPIGCLGGLIGLGGAEFRLPVLIGLFRKRPKTAVALNMAVSLITILSSICFRIPKVSIADVTPLLVVMLSIIGGSLVGAYFGADLTQRISNSAFRRVLLVLLVFIGVLLMAESFLPFMSDGVAFGSIWAEMAAAIVCGLGIGVFSSLLGVAGGELIIPTLILIFGVDAKLAGTVSLMISLPTILVGIAKHASNGMYADKSDFGSLVIPMGIGSIVGSFVGAALVSLVSGELVRLLLGVLLVLSAIKIFVSKREAHVPALSPE
jgi:uncharacterized protein